MSGEGVCGCPTWLGYRFHRYPCPRSGEIETTTTSTPTTQEAPDGA